MSALAFTTAIIGCTLLVSFIVSIRVGTNVAIMALEVWTQKEAEIRNTQA
jgi:hypothetical protein